LGPAIESEIAETAFLRAPSEFEALKSQVRQGRSTEVEQRHTALYKVLDPTPENKITGSKLLQTIVRSRVFVDCRAAMLEKEDTRGRPLVLASQGYEAVALLQNVTVEIRKESERLGRRAVAAASLAEELVKDFHGIHFTSDFHVNACSLGFPDGGTSGTLKSGEHIVVPMFQFELVIQKHCRRDGVCQNVRTPTKFPIFPAELGTQSRDVLYAAMKSRGSDSIGCT
jgi:hypothetical protein